MPGDLSPLAAAAAAKHDAAITRARAALRRIERSGAPITFASAAAEAGVSRAWLYSQPDIRAAINKLRDLNGRSAGPPVPSRQRGTEAGLLRRLEAAHSRSADLGREVADLREQLAAAHGMIRDLRAGRPGDAHLHAIGGGVPR